MKRILFILMALLSFNAFAEPLTGIFDVKFGDNQKLIVKKMKKQQWKNEGVAFNTIYLFTKKNGTFESIPVKSIYLDVGDKNKLSKINIIFKDVSYSSYKDMVKAYLIKYGTKNVEISDASVISGKSEDSYIFECRTENNIKICGNWISKDICTLDFEDCNSDL